MWSDISRRTKLSWLRTTNTGRDFRQFLIVPYMCTIWGFLLSNYHLPSRYLKFPCLFYHNFFFPWPPLFPLMFLAFCILDKRKGLKKKKEWPFLRGIIWKGCDRHIFLLLMRTKRSYVDCDLHMNIWWCSLMSIGVPQMPIGSWDSQSFHVPAQSVLSLYRVPQNSLTLLSAIFTL